MNNKKLEIPTQAIRICSQAIWVKFAGGKLCHVNNEKRKLQMMVGIEQTKLRQNRTLVEKETYKYLGILETGNLKYVEVIKK